MSSLPTGLGGNSGDGIEFAWRDVFLNALLSFVLLVVLLMFYVHPEAQEETEQDLSPGNVILEISWPSDRNVDVDMWAQAPGDTPVGYSALAGKVMNLLRDDLGHQSDLSNVNLENAYSRGIPDGEYCLNVHHYRPDNAGPIEVACIVRVRETANAPAKQILSTTVTLRGPGEEKTAFRFKLKDGKLVDGSVHSIFKPLRSSRPAGPAGAPPEEGD